MKNLHFGLLIGAILVLISGLGTAQPAKADTDDTFAPIIVDPEEPDVFYLFGDIDGRTAFNFKRAVARYGKPSEFYLTSGGGIVHEGLIMALELRQMGVKTTVYDYCLSACFFVFMAGTEREIFGNLGVHQMRNASNDLATGQVAIADVIDVLNQLDVNREVMVHMFQTAAEDIYIFSEEEIALYGLETVGRQFAGSSIRQPQQAQTTPDLGQAINFVAEHNRMWSQENLFALSDIQDTYAARVDFHGNDWGRDRVMQDKIEFADRWPIRDYTFRPDYRTSFCRPSNICTVFGEVDWSAWSPERDAVSSGVSTVEITLRYASGGFRIIGEKSRVIARN